MSHREGCSGWGEGQRGRSESFSKCLFVSQTLDMPQYTSCKLCDRPNANTLDHYCLQCPTVRDVLPRVRAGSVIFLVGVGSLVCWKLWEHWRNGGSSTTSPTPNPESTPPSRRPRGILASLLEEDLVQDLEDLEDEDPALIHGKYFGPDSPCSEAQCDDLSLLSSDVSEASNCDIYPHNYHADKSNSYSAGDV
ncbi:hypothetical protein SK128_017683, partial [Halocaridina rubra]